MGSAAAGGLGGAGQLALFAGGFVLVHHAFFGGGVDGALSLGMSFGGFALAGDGAVEGLDGFLEAAFGFTVANGGLVGNAHALFG